jgi:hypothetical protein
LAALLPWEVSYQKQRANKSPKNGAKNSPKNAADYRAVRKSEEIFWLTALRQGLSG